MSFLIRFALKNCPNTQPKEGYISHIVINIIKQYKIHRRMRGNYIQIVLHLTEKKWASTDIFYSGIWKLNIFFSRWNPSLSQVSLLVMKKKKIEIKKYFHILIVLFSFLFLRFLKDIFSLEIKVGFVELTSRINNILETFFLLIDLKKNTSADR